METFLLLKLTSSQLLKEHSFTHSYVFPNLNVFLLKHERYFEKCFVVCTYVHIAKVNII